MLLDEFESIKVNISRHFIEIKIMDELQTSLKIDLRDAIKTERIKFSNNKSPK